MTGTEMLIETMSDWGEHGEPRAVLIIYTDTEGCVWLKTNCSYTNSIGMAEYAKHNILHKILNQPDEDKT